eukprot:CAMPEP_0196761084 /NCGR_PEP_ID=MMETSP1095-20130614/199_1 /TAXON_ID=96789 ORGANISM="Chromulina nebulosa, Strain UTEXLB2642" /NCGR_SAMPLE_ID=MMETSP1095 /ASSEMBLY_ACC=CAM_ASM_000446 /LENGTH=494 /DNA_ID=CAMNT_0042110169 /DNA_START=48 /DNA_END=1532 /DNA_ORIENTATION=+
MEENDILTKVESVRKVFNSGKSKSYEFRIKNIKGLKKFLKEKENEILVALTSDLGRAKLENQALEIMASNAELDCYLKNLKSWMQPVYVSTPAVFAPSTSYYINEPYGVALIIGPFNYPVNLFIVPLAAAISAGNVAIIKPSELCPACEALFAKYLPQYIDNECYKIVCGAIKTTQILLSQKWDKIFFTGSTRVGKIVMKAAAENLTSVSLELGGKSPVIIDESITDIDLVTRRILWGKSINAGQTCIAPDYVLCHSKHYDNFIEAAKKTITKFYGEDPEKSPDFGRIVSTAHAERIGNLIKANTDKVVVGGVVDIPNRYISPTILKDVELDSVIMQEEIFGPVLPVIKVDDINSIIDIINRNEKPLALYIFSKNQKMIDNAMNMIQSGDCMINDTLFHFTNTELPFGGVSSSGVGHYHGKFSFDAFSHQRSVVHRDDHAILDIPIRYPPYSDFAVTVLKYVTVIPNVPHISTESVGVVVGVVASVIALYFYYK